MAGNEGLPSVRCENCLHLEVKGIRYYCWEWAHYITDPHKVKRCIHYSSKAQVTLDGNPPRTPRP